MTTQQAGTYKPLDLPGGKRAWIPSDLDLVVPETTAVAADLLHYLIYIPWNPSYLERVDPVYRDFFSLVLPYLRARTTDVHVATCLPFARELIQEFPGSVDERVVHVAFILHDSGWSQMTEVEIAASLGVAGLALSGEAVAPKARHVELARDLAVRILGEYPFVPPLTDEQKEMIYTAILFHDKPEELAAMGGVPAAIQIVCDTDHLWSFTHENFWQDTVRKGVNPPAYLDNLGKDLDGYFVTPAGKKKAARMLQERAVEVGSWQEWVDRVGSSPPGNRAPGVPPPLKGLETPIADVSHVRRKWLDIPYADAWPAQQLDIYLPETGDGPFPVLLHIHGGGFAIGDKRDTHILAFLREPVPGLRRRQRQLSPERRGRLPGGTAGCESGHPVGAGARSRVLTGCGPHRGLGRVLGRELRGHGRCDCGRHPVRRPYVGQRAVQLRRAGGRRLVRTHRFPHHGRAARRERPRTERPQRRPLSGVELPRGSHR